MNKTAAVVGGMLTLGATLVGGSGSALVGAPGAATSAVGDEAITIHVVDTDEKVAFHDFNHNGRPDFGDIVVFRSVDTAPAGRQVGHGIGQVDIQGPHDNLLVFTLVLANGDITMQGDITGLQVGARSQLAVTGGTGRYANARGVTTANQIGDGATDLVIRLES